jgi:hypothetical protein
MLILIILQLERNFFFQDFHIEQLMFPLVTLKLNNASLKAPRWVLIEEFPLISRRPQGIDHRSAHYLQEDDESRLRPPQVQSGTAEAAATALFCPVGANACGVPSEGIPMPSAPPLGAPPPANFGYLGSITDTAQEQPATALAATSSSTGKHQWSPASGSAPPLVALPLQVRPCKDGKLYESSPIYRASLSLMAVWQISCVMSM